MLNSANTAERIAPSSTLRVQTCQQVARRSLSDCFAYAPVRHFGRGEQLFAEGDAKSHVYRVEAGSALMSCILKDGRRQVVGFAFPGDYISLVSAPLHAFEARTIAAAQVRCIPISSMRRWASEDLSVADDLHEAISKEFAQLQAHFLTIGRLGANGRVATFLLALAERCCDKDLGPAEVQLTMLRSDIADFLCLSVETVSRALTELKDAKIITLKGTHLVTVIDHKALTQLTYAEYTSRAKNMCPAAGT